MVNVSIIVGYIWNVLDVASPRIMQIQILVSRGTRTTRDREKVRDRRFGQIEKKTKTLKRLKSLRLMGKENLNRVC